MLHPSFSAGMDGGLVICTCCWGSVVLFIKAFRMCWRLLCDALTGRRRRRELLHHLHAVDGTGVLSLRAPTGGEKHWQKSVSYNKEKKRIRNSPKTSLGRNRERLQGGDGPFMFPLAQLEADISGGDALLQG